MQQYLLYAMLYMICNCVMFCHVCEYACWGLSQAFTAKTHCKKKKKKRKKRKKRKEKKKKEKEKSTLKAVQYYIDYLNLPGGRVAIQKWVYGGWCNPHYTKKYFLLLFFDPKLFFLYLTIHSFPKNFSAKKCDFFSRNVHVFRVIFATRKKKCPPD